MPPHMDDHFSTKKILPLKNFMSILNFQPHIRVLVNALSLFECNVFPNLFSVTLLRRQSGASLQPDLKSLKVSISFAVSDHH